MYYAHMLSNDSTHNYMLLGIAFAITFVGFVLLRKMVSSEHKQMLEDQAFALANPDKIEKIKLVDRREVYCVATIEGKESTIIASGVQAVRIFDQLVAANPKLAK